MFDPKKYLIKVQGNRQYLPVAARLIWFREQHPDWGIATRAVQIDAEKQFAIFEATIFDSDGKLVAMGTKMENVRGFPDYVEKAETGAVGRALAVCGFGTQFAPDIDETGGGRYVDAPQSAGTRRSDQGGYAGPEQGIRGQRSSAANAQPAGRAADSRQARPPAGRPDCASCGKELQPAQIELSIHKYGKPFCPVCQRWARPLAEAASR